MILDILRKSVDEFESEWLKKRIKSIILNENDISEAEIWSKSLEEIKKWEQRVRALRIILAAFSLYLIPLIYVAFTRKQWLKFENIEKGRTEIETRLTKGFETLNADVSDDKTNQESSPRNWKVLSRVVNSSVEPSENKQTKETSSTHYKIMAHEFLGRGGFGVVKKGVYREGDEPEQEVAIKTVRKNEKGQDLKSANESLLVEAKTLQTLQHPNIISIITAGTTTKGKFTIVMELADTTFHDFALKSDWKRLALNKKLEIPIDIASGVTYLHNTVRMVHRDLKGTNVLLLKDTSKQSGWVTKLCDFGAAVSIDQAKDMKVYGTTNWLAPEALRAKNEKKTGSQTTASDIWSMAFILFMMYKPGEPFDHLKNASSLYTYLKMNNREYMPSAIDPGIKALVQSCWKFNPDLRPKIEAVKEGLEAIRTATNPI